MNLRDDDLVSAVALVVDTGEDGDEPLADDAPGAEAPAGAPQDS